MSEPDWMRAAGRAGWRYHDWDRSWWGPAGQMVTHVPTAYPSVEFPDGVWVAAREAWPAQGDAVTAALRAAGDGGAS